jgi:hypothetical protein
VLIWTTKNSKYEGEWLNGQQHGEGTFTYEDGSTYKGRWVNNMRDGRGTMTW